MPRTLFLPVLVLPFLAACGRDELMIDTSVVNIAQPSQVVECLPLQLITTTTGVFGTIGQGRAMDLAREETLRTAIQVGADTIVYENGAPGSDDIFVRAAAYDC